MSAPAMRKIQPSAILVAIVESSGFFFFQAEDGIRDADVTGVQTCALPIFAEARRLLKEAGHGSGFEHRLVVSNSPASREKTAVVVQAMAEQIGIRFNIELMDNAR